MTSARWPASVYRSGQDPDPRFSLANERTFLAWIRTSLALIAVAAAFDALPLRIGDTARTVIAVVLALTGLVAALHAWHGWARTESAMRQDRPLPGNSAGALVVGGVSLAGLILLVATLVAPAP